MPNSHYRELKVWQCARVLAKNVYDRTRSFPREEMFGITQQMRRAAISILSNIAEGSGRWSSADYRHFLIVSRGSSLELEAQIVISEELGFLSTKAAAELNEQTTEIARMLNGIIRYLDRR